MGNLMENLMENLIENLMGNLMANNQEDLNVFFDETIKTKAEQCGTYTIFHGLQLSLSNVSNASSVITCPGGDGHP